MTRAHPNEQPTYSIPEVDAGSLVSTDKRVIGREYCNGFNPPPMTASAVGRNCRGGQPAVAEEEPSILTDETLTPAPAGDLTRFRIPDAEASSR